jgi:glycosyltransferase involved in cell wall biosynthesis
MEKLRVLFLPPIDTDNTNAQSLNAREISLRLDAQRFRCTLWYEREPDPRLKNRPGIRLLRLPSRYKTFRILKEFQTGYDLVTYVDCSPASYLFMRLPRSLRRVTKTVLHVEAPSAQIVNPTRTMRWLYNGIIPYCDIYTAITQFVARDVDRQLGRRPSHILPVGVDTKTFFPPAKRTHPRPVILFAGTIIERKGPQHVVEAAAKFPNALFRLVGSGRDGFETVLRDKINQLNLKNVTLEGPKTQTQILQIMRESDIFLLPSRLEGIPKVTLEAAATGLPCIVFRDYETPSVVHGQTGFQVGELDEMMNALERLITDPGLREQMGSAGRAHVAQFDWDVVSKIWEEAYLQIAHAEAG